MMQYERKNRWHGSIGMRKQLFILFATFVGVVIVLLWGFQVILLEPMYQFIKRQELHSASSVLASSVEQVDWQDRADKLAQRTNICITIYRIEGQRGKLHIVSHINTSCVIHNTDSDAMLNRLYAGAYEKGYYSEYLTDKYIAFNKMPESIIGARFVEGDGQSNYLIVLNTEIAPVGTTKDTLLVQTAVISLILLAVAAIVAVYASGKMTRPIEQMSEEAKKLAQGNYDVHFYGGSTREIAELSETLNYTAAELSTLDSMQKELIANISHDLRTPLTMISGYSEVMRDIPGEMTAENMQIIIDETQRLSALVNDIMDLSKITGNNVALSCETFSLTDTVNLTLERYSKLRTHDGYTIRFEFDREACIYADKSKILQVLYNLVNNAINYTGEDKTVMIRQTCENGICRIEVTDTGEGIPAEQLPLIWDRYYKVKNYYKRATTGTGLGLSIVKNILILHGAEFGVQSTVGQGSTFWFSLPEISEQVAPNDSDPE